MSAVEVFSDGRVELRAGINSLDLETRLRFRVSPSRCEALARALDQAPEPSSPGAGPQGEAQFAFASPQLTSSRVFGPALPKPWQAVNAALDELLSNLELRGELAGKLSRKLRKAAESPEHWPLRVEEIHLDWKIDRALLAQLRQTPTPFPLALKGHYSLPRGQRFIGDKSPSFVVTEVVTGPTTGLDKRLAGALGPR